MLLSRATFLSNIFSGSNVLSSFELMQGYKPAILGLSSEVVTADLMEAYKDQATFRALHRLMKSGNPQDLPPSCLLPGTEIFYYFKTSRQNIPVEWETGKEILAHSYFVTITTDKGRKTNISYEDIRLKPNSALAQELSQGFMEDYMKMPQMADNNDDNMTADDSSVMTEDDVSDADGNRPSIGALMSFVKGSSTADNLTANTPQEQYIGKIVGKIRMTADIHGSTLKSQRPLLLQYIRTKVVQRQVTGSELQFAPQWLLNDALKDELDMNWKGAYMEVLTLSIPKDANVISSHVYIKPRIQMTVS